MESFRIEVQETLSRIIEVEASHIDDAISKVSDMYGNEEVVLDEADIVAIEISEYTHE